MRICYIADAPSIHTQRWVRYFADKGHEIHLISPEPFEGDFRSDEVGNIALYLLKRVRPRIRIIRIISVLIDTLYLIVQTRKLVRKIKPDILHSHYISDNGFLAAMTGFHPLVLSAWGSDILIDSQRYPWPGALIKYTLRKAALIFVDSNELREKTVNLGAFPEKVQVAQWGVDFQQFNPTINGAGIREQLNLGNCPTVIIVRPLIPRSNIECLISSIPFVLSAVPDAKFIIKGSGVLKKDLEEMADREGARSATRFVGKTTHDEIAQYLNASDVFVSTSLSDSTPVALLEAMACSLPVIVTALPSHREWVFNDWNGCVVPTRDPETLASKIVALLNDPGKRRLFGERSFEMVKEKADHFEHMKRIDDFYQELLGKKLSSESKRGT